MRQLFVILDMASANFRGGDISLSQCYIRKFIMGSLQLVMA